MKKDEIKSRKSNELGLLRIRREGSGLKCDFHPDERQVFPMVFVIHGREGTDPIVLCPKCELQLSERLFRDYLSCRGLKEAGGTIRVLLPHTNTRALVESGKGGN